jgi:D-glucosaminate-6-phosphate ammonia-lyase
MKRRSILKSLSFLPFSGAFVASFLPAGKAAAAPAGHKRNIFKELGLRTFVNAAGTYTAMTASLMDDEVMEVINEASKEFVMLDEVQDKVGERIAQMTHAEAATVTAGAFSALTLGTAGVLTGMDPKNVEKLPNLAGTGMKSEVIVQKAHIIGYVNALTNTGVTIVPVETADDVQRAISDKTSMMWFLHANTDQGSIKHQEWLDLARLHNIPTMIDIAADVPPVENLWKFNDMGFDLVCLSGGKAMRGPQSAGILMGRKKYIDAARLSAPPRGATIGRGMKVNKEEILGMYVALEKYINTDHQKEWQQWEDRVAVITGALKAITGVVCNVTVPSYANHTPLINVSWNAGKLKLQQKELIDKLRKGSPSIEVMPGANEGINITVFMLKPGQEKIVAARLKEELSQALA